MLHLVPGDPAQNAAGPNATPEDIELIRKINGLDKPLVIQYTIWVSKAVRGDLGDSFRSRRPVLDEIKRRFPATLALTATGLAIALVIGVPMGIGASLRPNRLFDKMTTSSSVVGMSMPDFVLGLLLMLLFSYHLRLLPPTGWSSAIGIVMPAITLSAAYVANFARLTRANMITAATEEYVRTARAKGLSQLSVTLVHVLPNSVIPLLTLVGAQFGRLLGGSIIVETIFAWPGIGRYMIDGLMSRDYNVVQGCVLVFGISVVICNLLSEILSTLIDPRSVRT